MALEALVQQYFPAICLGLAFIYVLWLFPKWQISSVSDPKDRLTLENAARQTLAQILGGTLILVGLYFTFKTIQITQEGQITDRFTKAIDQLGATGTEKLAIRLGAIYSLERIARDSEKDHWPIMEILTTYIRYHASWSFVREESRSPHNHQLQPDFQAILTVIGRRVRTYRKGEYQPLDLTHTDLRNTPLTRAHLEGAILWQAHLEDAILYHTYLDGAYLDGAYLEGAKYLTVEQLATVKTLHQAHLDPPLLEQIQRQHPHLLEKPELP
jgi:hypothetical protein